jgi:hypothetical protein
MKRIVGTVGSLLLTLTMVSLFSGCYVSAGPERRCPNGWEPEHRDRDGRLIEGHCR